MPSAAHQRSARQQPPANGNKPGAGPSGDAQAWCREGKRGLGFEGDVADLVQPPEDSTRISLERFSPNFNKPEIGFSSRRPSQIYHHIYDLPDDELADPVYLFDTSILGITGATKDSLRRAVALWEERYPNSRLLMVDGGPGGEILIEDLRQGWPQRRHRLDGRHSHTAG